MSERKEEDSPMRSDHPQVSDNHRDKPQSYEEIMGISGEDKSSNGISSLSSRLETFRRWLVEDAKIIVHPSVCVVNGEATDGTKNAPVMVFERPPTATPMSSASNTTGEVGRLGFVDSEADRTLYDRTMGCQVRAAREIKKDEVILTIPIPAMITPDLVAASDAGRSIAACCYRTSTADGRGNFWDVFENTAVSEDICTQKVVRNTGTQLLVKILLERKRVDTAFQKAMQVANKISVNVGDNEGTERGNDILQGQHSFNLSAFGAISTRAPFLAFLIHQRFSNKLSPKVTSDDDFDALESTSGNVYRIRPSPDSPSTFAPYARTLPSSVSLPICWKRNELALLAGCIPGISPLQQIAARTMQLATEFIALLDAGILFRFPRTFPLGLVTWDRWVWAAAVFTSRILPAKCCLWEGESKVSSLSSDRLRDFQSSPEVWDELGVMIPFMDMLNHEGESNQVTWEHYTLGSENNLDESHHESSMPPSVANVGHHPRAILHTRVKKGAQIYTSYGHFSNQDFILQYGFAQIGNPSDELGLGWSLADAVGNVKPPNEYVPPFDEEDLMKEETNLVFESTDSDAVNSWWSDARLSLFEKEVALLCPDSFMIDLRLGKKTSCTAYNDGALDPILLTSAVVATIPTSELLKHMSKSRDVSTESPNTGLPLTKPHQRILRSYLVFVFSRKLEKLLQNLNNGLKDHFSNLQLWTRVTHNGLRYTGNESNEDCPVYTGWQTFFDSHAYTSTIEVEKRYYSMAPVSCVLTLYDGHLRSLQASLEGLSTWEKFEKGALEQLEKLGFVILNDDESDDRAASTIVKVENGSSNIELSAQENYIQESNTQESNTQESNTQENNTQENNPQENNAQENHSQEDKVFDGQQKKVDGKPSPSKSRRRNRKKQSGGERPPALKLHIGNLSYTTTPSELYDYFAHMYGRENVLECHIPTERATGKSRGFGFVTMPEVVARRATQSGRKHEIQGRFLKVAESNSAGATSKSTKAPVIVPVANTTDRCMNCGYRPKYCVCDKPYAAGLGNPPGIPSRMDRFDRGDPYERDFYHYGPGGGRSHNDIFSRSYSPSRRGSRDDRERDYRRDVDRDYRYRRSDSRSDSGSRGRERGRSRSERKTRERSGSRSPPHRNRGDLPSSKSWEHKHARGSSRRSRSDSHERSPSRSRSYSDRRERRTSLGESLNDAGRGGAKSRSPHADPSHAADAPTSKKRESRKRSRSRSRGKSSRKKSKKDSRRHARSSSRSESYSDRSDHK
jgi:RNA recognition motif-containing protein